MRIVLLIALLFGNLTFASFNADAQEGSENGETAESVESEADEADARRRRMGNVAKLEVGDKTIVVSYGDTPTDGPDYLAITKIADGDVIRLTKSIVTKLKTDLDLEFDDTPIKVGNAAKNYPGVYGLWLRRVDEGWHLVFNEYADVWGTQHFPEGDVAEVPLVYAIADEAVDQYTVNVDELEIGGVIRINWGKHQWTARFTVAQ